MDSVKYYSTQSYGQGNNPSILPSKSQTNWLEPQTRALSYLGDIVSEVSSQLDKLKEIIQVKTTPQIIEIRDLDSYEYQLKQPLQTVVNFEAGQYFAELLEFDVYGEGEDIKSALEDLKSSFIQYIKNIREYPNLSKRLQVKKKILSELLHHED